MGLLARRLALVTGGGSGIGKAVCQSFAKEGARVIVSDIDERASINTVLTLVGDGHAAFSVDVSSYESIQFLFKQIEEKYTHVPTIIVNAAVNFQRGSILDTTEELFDDVIGVNLKGAFFISQAAAKLMVEDKVEKGSIINVSNVSSKVGLKNYACYAISKGGLNTFTKTMAKEFHQYNIRCNAVMPGYIDNAFIQPVTSSEDAQNFVSKIPSGRVGSPEEVAETILFLASEKSSYIIGETIQISGGLFM